MKPKLDLTVNIRGQLHDFSRPWVMGILNVTDDSFYCGCRTTDSDEVIARIQAIRDEGADCIDIGACSTRPGSQPVDPALEWKRLKYSISAVRRVWPDAIISIDTFRASVAEKCVEIGADIINDISGGLLDPDMAETVARLHVPYVLTHMRGTPDTMSSFTDYRDVTADVISELAFRIRDLRERGVCDIIIDPGFGFAKTAEQNYELLANLGEFVKTGLPLLVGVSRKSMIWRPLGVTPEEALPGSIALGTAALLSGANILRVHDVAATVQMRDTLQLLLRAQEV